MGGKKKMKRKILEVGRGEASTFSNYSAPARNLRKKDLGAVIFGCKHSTIDECLSTQLFGLPASHFSYIRNISEGLVLFLFNYSDRQLHGIFEAASPGQLNINPFAWVGDEDQTGYTHYPAQVRVRLRLQCRPLSENHFGPIIASNYYENKLFYFELDHNQTKKLVSLFTSSAVDPSASSSRLLTKWNNHSSSLPAPTRKQAHTATQDWEEASFGHEKGSSWDASPLQPTVGVEMVAEDVNQTSRLSYASILSRNTATTFASATSSLPTGNWSALSKDHSGFEATNQEHLKDEVVTRNYDGRGYDDLQWNQEHEDKNDSLQESTWEDSQLVAATKDVECVQTGVSHLSLQENIPIDESPLHQETEDKANFLQANNWEEGEFEVDCVENNWEQDQLEGDCVENNWEQNQLEGDCVENNWEESQHEADHVQNLVADSSQEHLNEPFSSESLNANLKPEESLSNKTNESDEEEKHEKDGSLVPNPVAEPSTNLESLVVKLMQEVEVLKGSCLKLEQELVESKLEVQWLRSRLGCPQFGSPSIVDPAEADDQLLKNCHSKFVDSIFVVGGYDGSSWLATLDSYFPSHDVKSSLSPMKFLKKYASAATLNGELYHFGGMGSHTVESFSLAKNEWVLRPPLYWKNIHAAGASIKDNLFVVGGGNGHQCSSEVEYLDLNIGKWLPARSMQSKRLAPAAAELNNALYVAGGYDGVSYVSSVERFDPREKAWYPLSSMNKRKGCHSLVVLKEKLYALGGFDGAKYIPSVECFDTRMGLWVDVKCMNVSRGNLGVVVVGEKLYAIGGAKENNEVLDIVEYYEDGSCWEIADLKAIGKRSHFSAIVL